MTPPYVWRLGNRPLFFSLADLALDYAVNFDPRGSWLYRNLAPPFKLAVLAEANFPGEGGGYLS